MAEKKYRIREFRNDAHQQGADAAGFSAAAETFDEELLPSKVFFIDCKRHDKDRVELQFGFDGMVYGDKKGRFVFDIDFILFSPKTLGLGEIDSVEILNSDVQSYLRLHSYVSDPKSDSSHIRLMDRLRSLEEQLNSESFRLFAIEIDGFIKGQKNKLRKIIKQIKGSKLESIKMSELLRSVEGVLHRFRKLLERENVYSNDASKREDIHRELLLLNEYASHLYLQFLALAHSELKHFQDDPEIVECVQRMSKSEYAVREKFDLYLQDIEADKSGYLKKEDNYLRRISLLKKYFHKPLYVKFQAATNQKRMLIPVYGISAALAAAWAIMIQIYTVENIVQQVGINTIAFIAVGVLAYVAKDIMKDFLRKFFFRRSRKWFPDLEKKLYAKREGKSEHIGVIKEYASSFESKTLPKRIVTARYVGESGAIEKILGEDCFQFRKRVMLDMKKLSGNDDFPWGLRDIIRLRFDRLMVSMEDAFKKLPVLNSDGCIEVKNGRRIYRVHLAAQVRARGRSAGEVKSLVKAFRITLDKNGVIDCRSVDWDVPLSFLKEQ